MSAVSLGLAIQLCSTLTLLTYGNLLPVLYPSPHGTTLVTYGNDS